MQGAGVDIGIDGHGLDPHPLTGLDDPNGDFATVGNKNFIKHSCPDVVIDEKRDVMHLPTSKKV
jgi:hypothetical protein